MDELTRLSDTATVNANLAVAIAISIGTLYCVLGYRTLKFIIAITGFALAAVSAAYLARLVSEDNIYAVAGTAAIGGLCGAAALLFIYKLGVFCVGLAGALLAAMNVLAGRPEPWIIPTIIGIGLLGGLLAILVERPVMTLATAAIGAWIVVCGIAFFVKGQEFVESIGQHQPPTDEERIVFLCWIVLALAGALAQFATHKPKQPPQPRPA